MLIIIYITATMHYQGIDTIVINPVPLLHGLFFSSVFEIKRKVGCYRLSTHRRSDHRKFLSSSLLILKSKFWPYTYTIVTDMQQRVNNYSKFSLCYKSKREEWAFSILLMMSILSHYFLKFLCIVHDPLFYMRVL